MKKGHFGYKVACINATDYNIEFEFETDNKLLVYVFKKAKEKLKRKKDINVKGDIENIQHFKIPPQYFNYLKTIIMKPIRIVTEEVKADGIHLLSQRVTDAKFIRNSDNDWNISILVSGTYADKR